MLFAKFDFLPPEVRALIFKWLRKYHFVDLRNSLQRKLQFPIPVYNVLPNDTKYDFVVYGKDGCSIWFLVVYDRNSLHHFGVQRNWFFSEDEATEALFVHDITRDLAYSNVEFHGNRTTGIFDRTILLLNYQYAQNPSVLSDKYLGYVKTQLDWPTVVDEEEDDREDEEDDENEKCFLWLETNYSSDVESSLGNVSDYD